MKKKFSTSWKSSKQPRKQRKYLANAFLHIKRKNMSVNLSKELRKKHGKRNFPLKKGDSVKIFRGKFKGKHGKITGINVKKQRVEIEGIQIKKQDGSRVNVWLRPSNLQITELNLDDKKRNDSLNRKPSDKNSEIKKPEQNKNTAKKPKKTHPSVAELKKIQTN